MNDVTAGQIVPADLLLTGGTYLSIDQAALAGESLPVSKAVGDVAYSGSIAKQGDMQGEMTAIGNATFFGRTAKLVASAGAKSHSEKAVVQIGDFLILLAAALAVALVGVQFPAARGRRTHVAVRRAQPRLDRLAAAAVGTVVPGDRGDPYSGRRDVRLRHSGADPPVDAYRDRLGLRHCVDGSHRSCKARLHPFLGVACSRDGADGPHDESALMRH